LGAQRNGKIGHILWPKCQGIPGRVLVKCGEGEGGRQFHKHEIGILAQRELYLAAKVLPESLAGFSDNGEGAGSILLGPAEIEKGFDQTALAHDVLGTGEVRAYFEKPQRCKRVDSAANNSANERKGAAEQREDQFVPTFRFPEPAMRTGKPRPLSFNQMARLDCTGRPDFILSVAG
jgi:hypothetical protein